MSESDSTEARKPINNDEPKRYRAVFRGTALPGYSVTTDGRFWTCLVKSSDVSLRGRFRFVPGDVWREAKTTAGGKDLKYLYVTFSCNGAIKKTCLHRIVYESAIGPIPIRYDVCHNDGNPLNNNVENLRADTRSGNLKDKEKHGTSQHGERNSQATISDEQVKQIREMRNAGEKLKVIAAKFNTTEGTVSEIARFKSRAACKI